MNFFSVLSIVLICGKIFANLQISWFLCFVPFLIWLAFIVLIIFIKAIAEALS